MINNDTSPNWINVGATLDRLPPIVRQTSSIKGIDQLFLFYFEGIPLGWSCKKTNGECLAGTILEGSFVVGSMQEGVNLVEEVLR